MTLTNCKTFPGNDAVGGAVAWHHWTFIFCAFLLTVHRMLKCWLALNWILLLLLFIPCPITPSSSNTTTQNPRTKLIPWNLMLCLTIGIVIKKKMTAVMKLRLYHKQFHYKNLCVTADLSAEEHRTLFTVRFWIIQH